MYGYVSKKEKLQEELKKELYICDWLEKSSWNRLKPLQVDKPRALQKSKVESKSTDNFSNLFDSSISSPFKTSHHFRRSVAAAQNPKNEEYLTISDMKNFKSRGTLQSPT